MNADKTFWFSSAFICVYLRLNLLWQCLYESRQFQGLSRSSAERNLCQLLYREPPEVHPWSTHRSGPHPESVVMMRDGVTKLAPAFAGARSRQFLGRRQLPESGH